MTKTLALKYYPGGRWAISRTTKTGEFISLIQDTPIAHESEIAQVFAALGLPEADERLTEEYFPKNNNGESCPTFALMSLWYELSPIATVDAIARV